MWPFISCEQAGCLLHYAKLSFWKVYRFVMYVTQGDLRPKKWVKNTHSSSTSVQRWQLDLSYLPYQKRSGEEKSGNCRVRSHLGEGHREGEGRGGKGDKSSSGGLYLWDSAAFRCEGWRTRGVKVSEVYSSAEPIFHNHYYFFPPLSRLFSCYSASHLSTSPFWNFL